MTLFRCWMEILLSIASGEKGIFNIFSNFQSKYLKNIFNKTSLTVEISLYIIIRYNVYTFLLKNK